MVYLPSTNNELILSDKAVFSAASWSDPHYSPSLHLLSLCSLRGQHD